MAKTLRYHLRCREPVSSSQSNLVRLAAGVLPLRVVTVRLSRGDPHKKYQRFAGRHAGIAEFNRLVPTHHHTGFSFSISGIRYGSGRASTSFRREKARPNVGWIVGRFSLTENENLVRK